MKKTKNQFVLILILLQFCLIVLLFVQNKRLQKQILVDGAKQEFLNKRFGMGSNWVDSIAINNDSLKFYHKGTFLGMSVIESK